MTRCIFTLDYEIYGNGQGTLRNLVLEPTQRLAELFEEFDARFVIFAEALEFARIEEWQSDPDILDVHAQMRELRLQGHEIALHLHPWWANAYYEDGKWRLDWRERSICDLTLNRVERIVSEAIQYLRDSLKDPQFTPVSFRSGLWLMQPTSVIAEVLARYGIRIDSSVFRGGRIHGLGLDYRKVAGNFGFWPFGNDVTVPDPNGKIWEFPILTEMVPFWQMLGRKRLRLQGKTRMASQGSPLPRSFRDFARLRYPRKLDFCRMTFREMREVLLEALRRSQDRWTGDDVIVAIGHSKDFFDSCSVRHFLGLLQEHSIPVITFSQLVSEAPQLLS